LNLEVCASILEEVWAPLGIDVGYTRGKSQRESWRP